MVLVLHQHNHWRAHPVNIWAKKTGAPSEAWKEEVLGGLPGPTCHEVHTVAWTSERSNTNRRTAFITKLQVWLWQIWPLLLLTWWMLSLHLAAAAGCQPCKQLEVFLVCAHPPTGPLVADMPIRKLLVFKKNTHKKKGFWGTGLALDYMDLIKDLETSASSKVRSRRWF